MADNKEASYFSEFGKMKHKPVFSFLVNEGDNAKMLESFGGYNNTWKRFAINGKICGAEHTDYFSDGFNTAGGKYEFYSVDKKGIIKLTTGRYETMYQGGNSEDPTAVISFEDIKDEKIRHLLAGNDIESENQKDITEWFYKNNGAEYRRHGTAYPITLFKTENGSERQWIGDYEILRRKDGQKSSKIIPSYPNMPPLPIDAKYALSGIMNMIPQNEEVQHKRIVVEICGKTLEGSATMKFAASLAAVQSLPADMSEKERYVLFKQKSKEEMERMKDRDLIDFSYSKKSIEARDVLDRCQNIGNLKNHFGEILYIDSEENKWYFDKIVAESICGRNYFLEAIPARLEKKIELSEVGDSFARELLQGKHMMKIEPIAN